MRNVHPRRYGLIDGDEVLIREATGQDAVQLLEFAEIVCAETDFLSFGPGELGISQSEEVEILDRFHESENQIYLVAILDSRIVGSLHFSASSRPRLRHCGEIGMSVLKSYWGRGIGSLLLDELLVWARENRITKINLRVRTDNERAIKLYERQGFVREGTIAREFCVQGKYFDHHWMGLEL